MYMGFFRRFVLFLIPCSIRWYCMYGDSEKIVFEITADSDCTTLKIAIFQIWDYALNYSIIP